MNTSVPYSALSHLECSRCGTGYDADQVQGTCTCGAPLLARYDIERVSAQVSREDIAAGRPTCGAITSCSRSPTPGG